MPPPRVYITVSRSGQTRRPNSVMSSPVLPMTVTSVGSPAVARSRPRRNRAPPMPPAGTTTRRGEPGAALVGALADALDMGEVSPTGGRPADAGGPNGRHAGVRRLNITARLDEQALTRV